MMNNSNRNLADLFDRIISKERSIIRNTLADYPVEIVIEYLLNEIQHTDDPWKLGRLFGAIEQQTNRYASIDLHIHSRYKISSVEEKVNILDFLSGYWDSVGEKLCFVIEIGQEILESISNSKESGWDKDSILLSIPLIALAYLNNKNNPEYEDELRLISEIITMLKTYTIKIAPQSLSNSLLQRC
jgi:hypothetical protein